MPQSLPSAAELVAQNRVLVIAHRGDSQHAPENTLPAFEGAIRAGADLVELDYHESADRVPLAFHDETLDRTTDAAALWGARGVTLAERSLAEIKSLDAGGWFAQQFAGTRVPMLVEALQVICPLSVALIEHKVGSAERLASLLGRHGWTERAVVQSFNWRFLAECHRLEPRLMLAALGEKRLTETALDEVPPTGAVVVAWENQFTDRAAIDAIHRRGWRAWVWTADDDGRLAELISAGIDGIITNRPARLRELLAAADGGKTT